MKRIILTMTAIVAGATMAETYDATTGYVTMGSGGGYGKISFSGAAGWSDGNEPHPGTNYYVGANYSIWYGWNGEDNKTFEGDKLVMSGTLEMGGNGSTYVGLGNTVWLPGSKLDFYTPLNFYNDGTFDVQGTEANPFKIQYDAKQQFERDWPMDFVSTTEGYAKFTYAKHNDKIGANGFTITAKGDWSQYHGTFEIAHTHSLTFSGTTAIPGTFKLTTSGARIKFDTVTEIGALETTAAGTIIDLSSGEAPTVTDHLTLTPGTVIWHNLLTKYERNYTNEKLLFSLSKEAIVPDFSQVTFVNKEAKSNSRGPLPKVEVRVDTTDDAQKVYLVQRKVVYNDKQGLGTYYNITDSSSWSDGNLPSPGNDYYCYRTTDNKGAQVSFGGVESPYVWTGGTMVMWDRYNDVMLYLNDITIADLWLNGGAALRTTINFQSFKFRGNVSIIAGSYGTVNIGRGCLLELYAALHGDTNTWFETDFDEAGQSGATVHTGTLSLKGDNSAFKGRLLVGLYDSGAIMAEANATSNLWLLADNANALGGDPGTFVADAISVTNGCHLGIVEDTTFAITNRGWYFGDGAYLDVAAGKTAKIGSTTTIDGTLIKTGSGAAYFTSITAGTLADATRKITVSEGCIGALASTAFGELPIYFAASTGLAVDKNAKDETIRAKGVTLDPSKITNVSAIMVEIGGVEDDLSIFNPYAISICTVPTVQAKAFGDKLVIKRPAKGIWAKLATTDNSDGTTTLSAQCEKAGFTVIVR